MLVKIHMGIFIPKFIVSVPCLTIISSVTSSKRDNADEKVLQ